MARAKGSNIQQLIIVLVVAIVGLYLFSQFSDFKGCTAADVNEDKHGCEAVCSGDANACADNARYRGFTIPTNLDETNLTVMQIMIVGLLMFAGYALVMKLSGQAFSRRDAMTLILLGLGLWWLWDNVLVNVLNASTLDSISFAVGQKLGFFP